MQTFMPHPNYRDSLAELDVARLGKQRVECLQILKALTGQYDATRAWLAHPAVRMWRGLEPALTEYTLVCCELWSTLGYRDSVANTIYSEYPDLVERYADNPIDPSWLSDSRIHNTHRAMLFRKNPTYYAKFRDFALNGNEDYFWPV